MEHAIGVAVETDASKIITVLGAKAESIEKEIKYESITVAVNEHWEEGIASSIRIGLLTLLEVFPGVQAAIIMVCDQPFVTVNLLKELVMKHVQNGKPIIASKYGGTLGTPALFSKAMFATLLELTGDAGAKKIIIENPDRVDVVEFPLGQIDIDTEKDYKELLDYAPDLDEKP
ncbi:MAG: nucleotidyltransferase family protein [Ferruginibacter sp.]|nr:nucleotidyltransferase family protein [Ferruginibacter sp.]